MSNETYISCSHMSKWEYELCLTFTPKPSQAACYCPDTHPCTEFTQRIQSLTRMQWEWRKVVKKPTAIVRASPVRQENPKGLEFGQSWSESSSLPLRSGPMWFLSGLGENQLVSERDGDFCKNFFHKIIYLSFCLSRALYFNFPMRHWNELWSTCPLLWGLEQSTGIKEVYSLKDTLMLGGTILRLHYRTSRRRVLHN